MTYIIGYFFEDRSQQWIQFWADWASPAQESALRDPQTVPTPAPPDVKIGYYWRVLFVWQESTKNYRMVWIAP